MGRIENLPFEPKFDSNGLLSVVTQCYKTGEVLMLAFANMEAIQTTIETKQAHYYSRSRQKLWKKGKTSGHIQIVHEIFFDCDLDAVLLKVEQIEHSSCHTGKRSCFFNKIELK